MSFRFSGYSSVVALRHKPEPIQDLIQANKKLNQKSGAKIAMTDTECAEASGTFEWS